MTGIYVGHIHGFKVSEKPPRGLINFHITVSATPISGQTDTDFHVPDFVKFKLDEDSDSTFEGMADICTKYEQTFSPLTIEVLSGAKDEIDTISVGTP